MLDGAGAMSVAFTAQTVESLIASGRSVRLDPPGPEASDFAVLSGAFGRHCLAVEDSEEFGYRQFGEPARRASRGQGLEPTRGRDREAAT